MTEAEKVFRETERERKRNSYGDRNKKRQGGRIRLPSDNLTKKERERLNGEMVTYSLQSKLSWKQYKGLPDDLKREYLTGLVMKYGATQEKIGEMFGVSRQSVTVQFKKLKIKPSNGAKFNEEAWYDFAGVDLLEKVNQQINEIIEEESKNIAAKLDAKMVGSLIEALAGSGAKLTLEITL